MDNNKNDEKKEKLDKEIEEAENKLRILEELAEIKGIKIINPSDVKKIRKINYINLIFKLVLLFAIHGIYAFITVNNPLILIATLILVPLIELLLNFIIDKFFIVILLKTMGLIKIIPSIIAFIVCFIVNPFVESVNYLALILIYIIYNVLKIFINITLRKLIVIGEKDV